MRHANPHTSWKRGSLGLLGLLLLGASSASCEQPELLCDTFRGPYVVKYIAEDPAKDCMMLPGELVGMATYNPPNADGTALDTSRTTISVQATSMGLLVDSAQETAGAADPAPGHTSYSLGDFSNKPGEDDFCSASGLTTAEQHIPETAYTDADGNAQVFPATRLAYQWSDLRVHTTFATPGNAATGTVTITKEVTDPTTGMTDTCSITYVASALFPAVGCQGSDEMGQPNGMPDDAKCCATADLASDRPFGSGINPDFKVKCDPQLLFCVLDWRPGEAFPPLGGNPYCGSSSIATDQ
jgi:hypothetical protein